MEEVKLKDPILFWGGIYSQWHRSKFVLEGHHWRTAEQYMMAKKAELFKDYEAWEAIRKSKDPAENKRVGRLVKDFDPVKWNEVCRLVVYRANLAKFSQDWQLRTQLIATGNRWIVEASPQDTVWGIGLAETDPDCYYPSRWKGTNWLGEAIMQVRSDILTLESYAELRLDLDE